MAHTYSSSLEDKNVNKILYLLHYFDIYILAVYYFAHRGVKDQLLFALTKYYIRLERLPIHYKFNSILYYYYAFITARI